MLYIRENDKNIIFEGKTKTLTTKDVNSADTLLKKAEEKNGIFNLKTVSEIKKTTLDNLKKIAEENKVSLCALDADIFAVINLLNYDKDFQIYSTEEDVLEDKYEMKNRKFKVV